MNEHKEPIRHRRGSLFGPLLLIALGIVFLLNNTGTLRGNIWDTVLSYWPVILIVIGLDNLYRREGLVGAVFMIGLGTVFLLSNLGYLNVNVWQMVLRLWPLLLVAIGLDIVIGRRSLWASLAGLVVLVALLVGALWLIGIRLEVGQAIQGQEVGRPLSGVSSASITLENGSGDILLHEVDQPDMLIAGTIGTRGRARAIEDYSVEGGRAIYRLRDEGNQIYIGPIGDDHRWDIGLTGEIPIDLNFNQGAGSSTFDLRGLEINDLQVNFGVGQTRLVVPVEGNFRAKIDGAIGQIVIEVPPGVGVRIHSNLAMANLNVPSDYSRNDNTYTSMEYAESDARIEIEVGIAIGNVTVREIEP
jgi:hypothetical protein